MGDWERKLYNVHIIDKYSIRCIVFFFFYKMFYSINIVVRGTKKKKKYRNIRVFIWILYLKYALENFN